MLDRMVVDKMEEVIGRLSVSYKFKNVGDKFEWALLGYMGLIHEGNLHSRKIFELLY